jgi:integrase/recombinase XerD
VRTRRIRISTPGSGLEVPAGYWRNLRERGRSPATIEARRHSLGKFILFLGSIGVQRLQDVGLTEMDRYRQWLVESGLSPNTCDHHLYNLRSLFDWLETTGSVFENPARAITLHNPPRKLPQVIGVNDVRKLLQAPDPSRADGIRDRAMIETLYATGMRRGELLSLTLSDLNLDTQTVRVLGKGRKERVLPLGKHAVAWVGRYLREARSRLLDPAKPPLDALWLNKHHRRFTAGMLNVMVRNHARQAGIGAPVSSHTLRRSCATHMLENGAHPLMVSELLGHSTVGTLTHYLRVTLRDLRKTHAASKPGE